MYTVQLIPGEVEVDATNEITHGITLTFLIGGDNAQPWLESALMNRSQGDVVVVVNNGTSYTAVLRNVTPTAFDASSESSIERAEECRITGNKLLTDPKSGRKEYREAIVKYNLALNYLLNEASTSADRTTPLRLNIALANLKLNNCDRAIAQCDAVLARYPDHAKALYRRAQASFKLNLFNDAVLDYENAKSQQPNHREIHQGLVSAINKQYATIQQSQQQYAQVYAKKVQSRLFDKRLINTSTPTSA